MVVTRPGSRHLFLAVVCFLALFAGLGRVSMWEPDEARFAEATRQMLARGDLLTPWFNDRPRFEKPVGLALAAAALRRGARFQRADRAASGGVDRRRLCPLHLSDRAQAVWRAGGLDRGARPGDMLPRHHARTSGPHRRSGALLRADRDVRLPARASGRVGPGLGGRLGRHRACGVDQGAGGGNPAWRLGGVPDGDARLERASPPAHRARPARRRGHRRRPGTCT